MMSTSFLVFLNGFHADGGFALVWSEGNRGSLSGSEAPGLVSQHGLQCRCFLVSAQPCLARHCRLTGRLMLYTRQCGVLPE